MKLKKDIELECFMARSNMNVCKEYNDNEAKMFYQGMYAALKWVLGAKDDGVNLLNHNLETLEEDLKTYGKARTTEMII